MPTNKSQAIRGYEVIRDKVKKMSLNVSYNQNFRSGIDTAAIKEVTQKIFQKASTKTVDLSTLDLTKFNRVTLGTDLYSGKVDASTASQIAMTKNGMQVNLSEKALNSLKYLSSEASKSVFSAVEGKVTLPEVKEAVEKKQTFKMPTFGRLTEATDLNSDKNGSNPFYKGELLNVKKAEEKSEDSLNIFA